MERNVNVTNEGLVESKEMRCLAMEDLPNNLRESAIWSIGTKFETVCGNYMTVNQVAGFFRVDKGVVEKYYDKHQRPESYNELLNEGMKKYSYKEINELIANTQNRLTDGSETPSELIENTKNPLSGGSENDVTNEFKPNPRGQWLFTLESVCKLGMFMTGTPKAKEFRDKIISTLKIEVMKTESLEKWHEATILSMKECVERCEPINGTLKHFKAQLLDDTKLMYKKELNEVIDKLTDVRKLVENKIKLDEDDEFQTQISNRNAVSRVIESILKTIQKLDDIIIGSVNQPGDYKREDILKSLYSMYQGETDGQYTIRCRKQAGVLNALLAEADLITITEHTQISKSGKTKILRKVTVNDKNPWVFDSIVGQFGKESQPTFHLTKYGYKLWTYLYTEAKKCLDNGLDGTHIVIDKEEFDAKYCFTNK